MGHSIRRPLREAGHGEIVTNVPSRIVREQDLDAGDKLAFAETEDTILLYTDVDAAPCIAPRRRLRRQSGEHILNIPDQLVDDANLDDTHAIDYQEPSADRIPLSFQEANR